jgi:hypothetical protein
MAEPDTESAHRKRVARFYLIIAMLAMRGADFLLLWYLSLPGYSSALFIGAIVGSILWTTALFIGIWLRQSWARYILIGFNCVFIALFVYPIFVAWGMREVRFTMPLQLLTAGVLLYAGATTLLVCSKRIRHLATRSMIGLTRGGR